MWGTCTSHAMCKSSQFLMHMQYALPTTCFLFDDFLAAFHAKHLRQTAEPTACAEQGALMAYKWL